MLYADRRKKSTQRTVKIYMLSSLLSFLCLSLVLVNAQAGLPEDAEKCMREGVVSAIKNSAEGYMLDSVVYELKASGVKCEDKDNIIGKLKEKPVFIDITLPIVQICCRKVSQGFDDCFKDGLLLSREIEADTIYTALCEGIHK